MNDNTANLEHTPESHAIARLIEGDAVVLPQRNEIDLRHVDFCDDCKSKLTSKFIRAFIGAKNES